MFPPLAEVSRASGVDPPVARYYRVQNIINMYTEPSTPRERLSVTSSRGPHTARYSRDSFKKGRGVFAPVAWPVAVNEGERDAAREGCSEPSACLAEDKQPPLTSLGICRNP